MGNPSFMMLIPVLALSSACGLLTPQTTPETVALTKEASLSIVRSDNTSGATIHLRGKDVTLFPRLRGAEASSIPGVDIQGFEQGDYVALYLQAEAHTGLIPQYLLVQSDELMTEQGVLLSQDLHLTRFDKIEFDPDQWNELASFPVLEAGEYIANDLGDNELVLFVPVDAGGGIAEIDDITLHFLESPLPQVKYVWTELSTASARGGGVLAAPPIGPARSTVFVTGFAIPPWVYWLGRISVDYVHPIHGILCELWGICPPSDDPILTLEQRYQVLLVPVSPSREDALANGDDEPLAEEVIPVEEVEVPDVIGMSFEDARAVLEALGFQTILEDGSSEFELGQVFRQEPEAGTDYVPYRTTVVLYRTVERLVEEDEGTKLAAGCVPTPTTLCLTVEVRDPNNVNVKVPGIIVTFTRSDNGAVIFSGVANANGSVQFLVPIRPVYYDYALSGYSDGSSCADSHNSASHSGYSTMWLQPPNPGGSGKCRYG